MSAAVAAVCGRVWLQRTDPIVVMKLVVKESSEKRSSRQLLPTPERQRRHHTATARHHSTPHRASQLAMVSSSVSACGGVERA